MKILIQLFEIIILKRRPQDISYDFSAAIIAVMATIATSYFSVVLANIFSNPLGYVLVQVISQAAIFYLLLTVTRKQVRFVQTITALFGITAIIQFITLLLTQVPLLGGLSLLLAAWTFYLMIVILKEAIDCSTLQSIILTILYHFVMGVILLIIFPEFYQKMQEIMLEAQTAT